MTPPAFARTVPDREQIFFGSFFQKRTACLLAFGLAIAAPLLIAPLLHLQGSIWAGTLLRKDIVVGLIGAACVAYLAAVVFVVRVRLPAQAVWIVLAVAMVARLGLVAPPPFMSSDVYRYAWDGRVQAAGINPYLYIPTDPALARLRDPAIFPNINRLDYAHTIYPPAAELVFLAAGEVRYSLAATKLALLALELAGMLAVWRVLVLAGMPPARLLIYAWNPLAIWSFAADGHVDGAMIGLLGLALLARASGRQGPAGGGGRQALTGALLGGAILMKFLPVVVAPALWRRFGWRLPVACAAVIAALYACYLGAGWQVLGFLPAYTSEEGLAQGSGFWMLAVLGRVGHLPHAASAVYVAMCALVLGAAALWMGLRQRLPDGGAEMRLVCGNAAILAGGTLLALSPHYPWYYPWLALFACLAPWRSAVFLSCGAVILYCDPYHDTILFPSLVFVPTLILAAVDWRARRPLSGDADAI